MSRLGDRIAQAFETLIRVGVGCFILIVVGVLVLGFLTSGDKREPPPRPELPYHPSAVGPRVPIPSVSPATLALGSRVYKTKGCNNCHGNIGDRLADPAMPDLTHEGRRNASIEWQMRNLQEHSRLFPHPSMIDYTDLPPKQLRALASYMATRR